ncbi:hypothetical protein Tco_1174019 [Tanacetum coccineum]
MPYPRFTKIIIHYFLSQHNSISKRQGSLYKTFEDDEVLGSLQDVHCPIHWFNSSKEINRQRSTRIQGNSYSKKATFDPNKKMPKKKLSSGDESDESDNEPANRPTGRRKPREINTHKAIKASKRESRFKHQSGGSSKGDGITQKVSTDYDEEDDESIDIEKTDNERTESDNDDHEMTDAVKTDADTLVEENDEKEHKENAKKVEEQKANEEQKGNDQAENEQVGVFVSMTKKRSQIYFSPPPVILSHPILVISSLIILLMCLSLVLFKKMPK